MTRKDTFYIKKKPKKSKSQRQNSINKNSKQSDRIESQQSSFDINTSIEDTNEEITTEQLNDREITTVVTTTKNTDGSAIKKIEKITVYKDGTIRKQTQVEEIEDSSSEDINEINEIKKEQNEFENDEQIEAKLVITNIKVTYEKDKSDNEQDETNVNNVQIVQEKAQSDTNENEENEIKIEKNYDLICDEVQDFLTKSSNSFKSIVKVKYDENNEFDTKTPKYYEYVHDFGSQLMSKRIHLLDYNGDAKLNDLKNNLKKTLDISESHLDRSLNAIDSNNDGVLNFVEFIDFFLLFFATKNTIRRNLISVLYEHCLSQEEPGYLNKKEANHYFNLLAKFYGFDSNHNVEFDENQISYEDFASKILPLIETFFFKC